MPIPFFKQTIAVLAYGSDTNGVLGAIEVASPRGAVPPLHVHQREDEAFYVVEGAYSVFIRNDVIEASQAHGSGDCEASHTAIRSIRSAAGI